MEVCCGPGDVEVFASRALEVRCRRCLERGMEGAGVGTQRCRAKQSGGPK